MDPLHYQPQGHIYVINTCKGHSGLLLWAFSEGNASSWERQCADIVCTSESCLRWRTPCYTGLWRSADAGRSGEGDKHTLTSLLETGFRANIRRWSSRHVTGNEEASFTVTAPLLCCQRWMFHAWAAGLFIFLALSFMQLKHQNLQFHGCPAEAAASHMLKQQK